MIGHWVTSRIDLYTVPQFLANLLRAKVVLDPAPEGTVGWILEPVSKPGCACQRTFPESVYVTHQRVLKLIVEKLLSFAMTDNNGTCRILSAP